MPYDSIHDLVEKINSARKLHWCTNPILDDLSIIAKEEKNDCAQSYCMKYMTYYFALPEKRPILKGSTLDLKNFFMFLIANNSFFLEQEFSFHCSDYFKFCHKKNNQSNMKQLKEDLLVLDSIIFSGTKKLKSGAVRLLQRNQNITLFDKATYQKGMVCVQFSSFFAHYLKETNIKMPFPKKMMELGSKYHKNQNFKPVFFKLYLHQFMGKHHEGENHILSIKVLLDHYIRLPYYRPTDFGTAYPITNVNKRLIGSFERCLTILEDEKIIKWEYCNKKQAPLSDFDIASMDKYSFWIEKYISYSFQL